MDLNTKIIEGVRHYPPLYDRDYTLDDRNQAWKKLAAKLQMPEQYLKIRWHCLLQRYQRDGNFKYAHKMSFLQRRTTEICDEQVENWPEFVITEDDLKDDQPEDEDDYEFLEIEEDISRTKVIKSKPVTKKETQLKNISQKMQNINNKSIQNNGDKDESSPKIFIQTVETLNKNAQNLKNIKDHVKNKSMSANLTTKMLDIDTKKKDEISKPNKVVEISQKPNNKAPCEITQNKEDEKEQEPIHVDNSKQIEDKEVTTEMSDTVTSERCEDMIFGELVSAMLKRMDESKKKNIKKEIMNILLT